MPIYRQSKFGKHLTRKMRCATMYMKTRTEYAQLPRVTNHRIKGCLYLEATEQTEIPFLQYMAVVP